MSITSPYVVDKTDWPTGPWLDEPDKLQWRTKAGLPGLIVRSNAAIGALCGYAAVNPGHLLYGKHYDEVALEEEPHGGLTYSNRCMKDGPVCHVPEPDEPDDVWWFGFDCSHYMDLAPGLYAARAGMPSDLLERIKREEMYRDIEYVRREVEALAAQLAEMS